MRRAAKVDANQNRIIDALRYAGATVQSLGQVGGGCPDLLVGYKRANILMEVKDGDKVPSARTLRESQMTWWSEWSGARPFLVESVDDALQVLKKIRENA